MITSLHLLQTFAYTWFRFTFLFCYLFTLLSEWQLIPLDILRDLVRHLQSRDDAVRIQAAWTLAAVFADQTLRSQASKHKIEEVLERMRGISLTECIWLMQSTKR